MDHNLEDTLNLDGAIESMDFDHAGVVINQGDISLESNESVIPIQFEEQQMLMDTGNEEIIVTDFMGDQFSLQEYTVQAKQTPEPGATVKLNEMAVISKVDAVVDLQLDSENVTQSSGQGVSGQQKYLAVKAALAKTVKKNETANIPKQVAIAPKPPKHPKQPQVLEKATFASGKQYSIAPKPVALVVNKNFKKVSLTGVQGNIKGNTVWAPLGKKVIMVPADAAQKIKFVPGSKSVSSTQMTKPVMAKVIVQGGQSGNDVVKPPAVVPRKIMPTINSSPSGTHYVMQPRTLPVSFARNKVLLGSPTKEGLRFSKKQIIAIKSPTSKLVPAATQAPTTKRVVITTNPAQNVIFKSTGSSKVAHLSKESMVLQGQHTQLHQVNVPGKGIQFIRLVTNPSTQAVGKAPPPKPGSWGPLSSHAINVPSKSFVLTDAKGTIIQMTAEKMASSQPPPLVITGSSAAPTTTTTERKLVRIAPVSTKSGQAVTQTVRSTQSLLAPLSTMTNTKVATDDVQDANKTHSVDSVEHLDEDEERYSDAGDEDHDMNEKQGSKITLQESTPDAVREEQKADEESEVHEDGVYDQKQVNTHGNSNNMNKQNDDKDEEHPLIVIPSNFRQPVLSDAKGINSYSDEDSATSLEEQKAFAAMINVETEITSYESPRTPEAVSETDLVTTDLGLRPRKACNCTKSQCLKLYCDCFANGEFCNNCNCNNCHNNLENEELRQRAIRACLERNPYAFRPKIGKSKTGGPDIIRRHNKGCNCKRSGCLKNYCECYEAKIACTSMCKCVGCRNIEETLERRRELRIREKLTDSTFRPPVISQVKQPCSFMTSEVIEAVCQCLIAAAAESEENTDPAADDEPEAPNSPVRDVIDEFARCLQEIIGASHQALPQSEEEQAC